MVVEIELLSLLEVIELVSASVRIGNCYPPEVVLLFTTKVVPDGVNDV